MTRSSETSMSREERLAAKLRENLRRRKVQGRQLAGETGESPGAALSKPRDEG